jgi:catechol 2,3-dioxygenase-like lactoylglutathione lyase family enzyme
VDSNETNGRHPDTTLTPPRTQCGATKGKSEKRKPLRYGGPTKGIIGTEFEDGAVVFFNMNDDLILALYPRAALAKDARVSGGPPSPAEFSIGHIVKSKQEVDALMKQAEKAGARITDPPHDRFWGGYSGYFQDLDGHLWEIAWNPEWEVKE